MNVDGEKIYNQEQTIIDWINTFEEPQCVLINSIKDISKGSFIIKLLKIVLKEIGKYEDFSSYFVQSNLIKCNTSMSRLGFVKEVLSKLQYIEYKTNSTEIIDILLHMKKLHDGKTIFNTTNKNHIRYSTSPKSKKNNISNLYEPGISQGDIKDYFKCKMENQRRNIKKNDNKMYIVKEFTKSNKEETAKFMEKIENSQDEKIKLESKRETEILSKKAIENIVKTVRAEFQEEVNIKKMNTSNTKSYCVKKSKESFSNSQDINCSHSDKVNKRRSRNENFLIKSSSNNSFKNISLNRSLSKNSINGKIQNSSFLQNSISPAKLKLFSTSVNDKEIDKIYTKREIGELNCSRGIPVQRKMNLFNYTLNYLSFSRPTEMILNSNFKKTTKYNVSVNFIQKNQSAKIQLNLKANNHPNSSRITPLNYLDIYTSSSSRNQRNFDLGLKDINLSSISIKNSMFFLSKDDQYLNNSQKAKIYQWLSELNLLKKCTKKGIDDIPESFEDGILLSELITIYEGKSQVVRGIVRNNINLTNKISNINKCLDFLRKIGKINPRHLYSSEAIAKGDKKIIWELLFDIWLYYKNVISGNINKSPTIQCKLEKSGKRTPISLKERKLKNSRIEDIYNHNDKFRQNFCNMNNIGLTKNDTEVINSKRALNIVSYYSDIPSINFDDNMTLFKRSPSPMSLKNNKLTESKIVSNSGRENGVFITMDHNSVDKVRNRLEKLIKASESSRNLTYHEDISRNGNDTKVSKDFLLQTSLNSNKFLVEFTNDNNDSSKDKEKINKILNQWLDICGITKKIDFTKEEIPDFKDGLILWQMISLLEKRKIEGINTSPTSYFACLNNIKKVLDIIRSKKHLPLEFAKCEEQIFNGNGKMLRTLLIQLRQMYKKETDFLIQMNE